MILGIDCSTSVIGYTIFDNNGKLLRIGFVNISRLGDFLDKAKFTKDYFDDLLNEFKIDKVCIEDISKKFRPGFSSAQVITILARFNGIVSHIIFDITNIKPTFLNATSARKLAYKKSFHKHTDIKKSIFDEVMKIENNLVWPMNKNGKMLKEVYDAVDSYTMARAVLNIGK